MKDKQKQQIIALRRDVAGYGSIVNQLGLSINTMKSFCRRHSLAAPPTDSICEQCGRPIAQNPGRKRKRFCCDACRNKWWNSHFDLVKRKTGYTFTCPTCGKELTVYGNRRQKFCSHAYYIAYRFWGEYAMDKRSFQNETTFQVTMHLARMMLAAKLITEYGT